MVMKVHLLSGKYDQSAHRDDFGTTIMYMDHIRWCYSIKSVIDCPRYISYPSMKEFIMLFSTVLVWMIHLHCFVTL